MTVSARQRDIIKKLKVYLATLEDIRSNNLKLWSRDSLQVENKIKILQVNFILYHMIQKHKMYLEHLNELETRAKRKGSWINWDNTSTHLEILLKTLESVAEEDNINIYINNLLSTYDGGDCKSKFKSYLIKQYIYLAACIIIGLAVIFLPAALLNPTFGIINVGANFDIILAIGVILGFAILNSSALIYGDRIANTQSIINHKDFKLEDTLNLWRDGAQKISKKIKHIGDHKITKTTTEHTELEYPPMPSNQLSTAFFAAEMSSGKKLSDETREVFHSLYQSSLN